MTIAEKFAKWKPLSFLNRSVENPSTPISDPAQWLLDAFASPSKAGVNVTENTAINLTAVWRAVNLTSNVLASLPKKVYEKTPSGRKDLPDHPVSHLLKKPNSFMTHYDWMRACVNNEGLSGNGITRIVFDNRTARPVSLMPIEWWNVSATVDKGRLYYVINTESGSEIIDHTNVVHFKGFSHNGIWGKSPVRVMSEAVGGALAAQEFGSRFFGEGANVGGFLSTDGKLSEKAIERLKESMLQGWQGLTNANKPKILEEGLKYQKVGIPPEDAQFLQTRKFHVTEIARMFDVPPPLMYDLERATFANVEKMILSYVKFDLAPKAIRMEQELSRKLLREDEQDKIFIGFNLDGLLRGDEKARAEFYQKLFGVGGITPNQIASLENMNSFEGGDKHFVPMNFQPLNQEENALKNLETKLQTNGTH